MTSFVSRCAVSALRAIVYSNQFSSSIITCSFYLFNNTLSTMLFFQGTIANPAINEFPQFQGMVIGRCLGSLFELAAEVFFMHVTSLMDVSTVIVSEPRLIRAILIANDADFSHILYTSKNTTSRNYKFRPGL